MTTYHTRPQSPPDDRRGEITPELIALRSAWYASRPIEPDWAATARQQKAAHEVMRERRAA